MKTLDWAFLYNRTAAICGTFRDDTLHKYEEMLLSDTTHALYSLRTTTDLAPHELAQTNGKLDAAVEGYIVLKVEREFMDLCAFYQQKDLKNYRFRKLELGKFQRFKMRFMEWYFGVHTVFVHPNLDRIEAYISQEEV